MAFFDNNELFKNNTALIDDLDRHYTYGQMYDLGSQILNGTKARRVLMLLCDNSMESISTYLAALQKGIIPLMVNSSMPEDLLFSIYDKYKPAYVFMNKEIQKFFPTCHCIREVSGYTLFQADSVEDYPVNDDLALLLTTSGSTGSPKLVRQSYKNIQSNASSIARYLDIQESDTAVTTLPLNYTYGLSIINSHMERGASIAVTNKTFFDKSFWEFCNRYKVTNFGGVPYSYDILQTIGFEQIQIPSLRYITQAGGKLHEEKVKNMVSVCEAKGIKFIIMYGQTEATARMSYLPWEKTREKSASIGIAIPDGRFVLEDDHGNEITTADRIGELVYYGPNVTLGYAESYMDLCKGDEFNGVLHTGDLAKCDTEGFYYIVGRNKRFIKLFGNRVSLDEAEQLLAKNHYFCVCGGKDDCLTIYTIEQGKDEEILDYISRVMGFHKNAFEVKYIKEIPRNQSGKVDYSSLI